MFAIHASYRGRSKRRSAYVKDIIQALSQSGAVSAVRALGVEAFVCIADSPQTAGGLVLSLLQAGDFAIGIGAVADEGNGQERYYANRAELEAHCAEAAGRAVLPQAKAMSVVMRVEMAGPGAVQAPGEVLTSAEDVSAAFTLLAHVLHRRTKEGREATALLRAGLSQSEAAAEVGISKQAMSQRLMAAGWQAEQAGWKLATNMLARIHALNDA